METLDDRRKKLNMPSLDRVKGDGIVTDIDMQLVGKVRLVDAPIGVNTWGPDYEKSVAHSAKLPDPVRR
jgi:hypothetical protein